jgi:hypothetical protein
MSNLLSLLAKSAAALDEAGFFKEADMVDDMLRSIANTKAYSIHMTFTRGVNAPVLLKVDVREKAGSMDDMMGTASMEPVESFSFDAKSISDAKARSASKVSELKSKYGVSQVLENMDPSLPR